MSKQRITVTVDDQTVQTLRRITALSGSKLSPFINELLSAVEPSLRQTADLLERAAQVKTEAQQQLAAAASQADAALRPSVQQAVQSWQAGMAQLDEAVSAAERDGGEEPPSSNTGVVR